LNLGITKYIETPIKTNNIKTAIIVENVHAHCVFEIRISAQMAMIGARTSIRSPMTKNTRIWVTSLVERLIKLALEKLLISSMDKEMTLLNSKSRSVAEKFAEVSATNIATITERNKLPKAAKSIKLPTDKISFNSLPGV